MYLLTCEDLSQSQMLTNHPMLEIFHEVRQLSLKQCLWEIEIIYPITEHTVNL